MLLCASKYFGRAKLIFARETAAVRLPSKGELRNYENRIMNFALRK